MTDLLYLDRTVFTQTSTIGVLFLEDQPFCWTLEDTCRKNKIDGKTAIPAGRYQIILHDWKGKGIMVPKLLNVPFYKDIVMHSGNIPEDTDGCIIVGHKATFKSMEESRDALRDLMSKIYPKLEKEEVFITIKGGYEVQEWELRET